MPPPIRQCSTRTRWRPCRIWQRAGLLPAGAADALLPAARLFNNLTQVLRLCLDGPFEPAKAPEGLKTLLARAGEAPDFLPGWRPIWRPGRPRWRAFSTHLVV